MNLAEVEDWEGRKRIIDVDLLLCLVVFRGLGNQWPVEVMILRLENPIVFRLLSEQLLLILLLQTFVWHALYVLLGKVSDLLVDVLDFVFLGLI